MNTKEMGSLLQELNLPDKFLTLAEGNPSSLLAYHNNHHCYMVAKYAVMLGRNEGLNRWNLQHLCLAGLFHDYNHTGNPNNPDSVNIEAAVQFIEENRAIFEQHDLSVDYVKQLIQATCNPPTGEYSLPEGIMRDADLLEWVNVETAPELMDALSEETGMTVTEESTRRFLQNTHFHTEKTRTLLKTAGWL